MCVVAVFPDRTASPTGPVDGAGEANGQAAGTARKGGRFLGLDDEVHVVVLRRELHHAETGPTRPADGLLDRGEDPLPQRRHVPTRAQGQVDGVCGPVDPSPPVGHRLAPPRDRRPSGAFPLPTPSGRPSQGQLSRWAHLNRAIIWPKQHLEARSKSRKSPNNLAEGGDSLLRPFAPMMTPPPGGCGAEGGAFAHSPMNRTPAGHRGTSALAPPLPPPSWPPTTVESLGRDGCGRRVGVDTSRSAWVATFSAGDA